jgi:hypothetical protein
METCLIFLSAVVMPWVWAVQSVRRAMITREYIYFKSASLAKLFKMHYMERVDAKAFTGRRILRMYYIFIGFVVWLVCQIIPFLAGFAAMLFWLFIIGFMTSIILGIA